MKTSVISADQNTKSQFFLDVPVKRKVNMIVLTLHKVLIALTYEIWVTHFCSWTNFNSNFNPFQLSTLCAPYLIYSVHLSTAVHCSCTNMYRITFLCGTVHTAKNYLTECCITCVSSLYILEFYTFNYFV